MARIYVSATYIDLKEYREQVRLVLRRMGHEDVAMEYYVAEDQRPLDKCLNDVASCDLYIGIFAFRYGYRPPEGGGKSITELEYRKAIETGKECLIFVAELDGWNFKLVEVEALDQINALRDELSEHQLPGRFSSKDSLSAAVTQAVHKWEKEHGIQAKDKLTNWDAYKAAVFEEHRWVSLAVIAGAKQDRITRIPLIEVFVPQLTIAGTPTYEVPDEILRQRRAYFAQMRQIESSGKETIMEIDPEIESENGGIEVEEVIGAFPEAVLDIFGREPTQVILGTPGSGKSSLFHYALLTLCNPEHSNESLHRHLQNQLIPFLVELRQYFLSKQSGFVEYIVTKAKERYGVSIEIESLKSLLKDGQQALVFFDGLDEVFDPAERSRVIQQFKTFARTYPGTRIVVTSRIAGYDKADLEVADFRHYHLLDFSIQQIREFVPKWYEYYTWEGDNRDAQDLIQRIVESPRLLELAGNPLLLTMMAVIYKHQDLPEQRWQLYARCTEVLLEHWEVKRKSIRFEELPLNIRIIASQKEEILQRVSMYMLENGQAGRELNAIAYRPLMKILATYIEEKFDKRPGMAETIAEGILNHLRERTYILAEIGEDIFGFVHRTFMEYFAACNCKALFNAKEADYDWLTKEAFGAHWQRDEWQEVLLLLIAMLSDQGSPIRKVVDYLLTECKQQIPFNVAFAARCLSEAGKVEDQEWAQDIIKELVKSIAHFAPKSQNKKAVAFVETALGAFSRLAPLVDLPHEARETIEHLNRSKTIQERMAAWQMGFAQLRTRKERLNFALKALRDKEEVVRRGAIAALEREWPGKAEVEQALLDVVRSDPQMRVRQAAVESLRRAWPKNEEILDALEAQIQEFTAYNYLDWVVEYLAANWKGHTGAFSLVTKRIGFTPFYYQSRRVAIEAIAQGWHDDPQTLPLLRDRAVNDDDHYVRLVAIEAIAQGWHDDPQTLPLLRDRVVNDNDWRVRRVAIQSIIQGWHDDPQTLPFLCDLAVNHADSGARRVAIQSIIQGWHDDPQTLPLLRDRAVNHTDSGARRVAIEAIAQGWHDDPQTLPLLRDRTVNDDDHGVRRVAIDAIAQGWHDDPQTLPLLRDRTVNDDDSDVRLVAIQSIIQGWHDDPQTLPLLRDRTVNDDDSYVRWIAIQSIIQGWHDDPQTLPLLRDRTVNDDDSYVRLVAIEAIAQGWHHDPQTLPLLRDRTVNDDDSYVRRVAIQSIAQGWHDDPQNLPFLCDLAVNHADSDIRWIAIQTIAQGWHDDPQTLPLLRDRAVNDADSDVRLVAIQSIAQGWHHDPQTLPLLRDRAINHADGDVRGIAIQTIAQGWHDDPQTLPFLYDLAVNHADSDVRGVAIQTIAQGWHDDPQTLPLLRDRAVNDADGYARRVAQLWVGRLGN